MLAEESGVSQPLSATHGRAQINLFGRGTDGEARSGLAPRSATFTVETRCHRCSRQG